MKSTIDYLFKDLSDNKDGKELFGFSAQTVKKCINDIEQNYFKGQKIYHGLSKSKNNAITFRCEIKGLLLLLLKLELEDVFRDDKSKATGVTVSNIDKIINTYLFALDEELLSDYEYRVLMQFSDMEDHYRFFDSIREFRDALARALIILATTYHDHTANYYKMFINRINDISVSMLYGSSDLRFLNADFLLQPLDLRVALIKAINRICDDFYYFKEDGICRRRVSLKETSDEYKELSSKLSKVRYHHLKVNDDNSLDNQCERISSEFEYDDNSIKDVRNELSNILEEYYKKKYPHIPRQTSTSLLKKITDDDWKKFEKLLHDYIHQFDLMKRLCSGTLSPTESGEIYADSHFLDNFYRLRFYLLHTELDGWSFSKYLTDIETELLRKIESGDTLTNDYLNNTITDTIKAYKTKIANNQEFLKRMFKKYNDKEWLEDEYEVIRDNISSIFGHCEDLAKEIIAMILKRESENYKANLPF